MVLQGLYTELRRRRVFRAVGLYIVAAWIAVQVISLIFPALNIPDNALLWVWLVALLLFPLVVVFAWLYELTPQGIVRTPAAGDDQHQFDPSLRRTDYLILAALGVVALAITLQFTSRIESSIDLGGVDQFSIAVLPLVDMAGNEDERYFAAGMQASLIAALSQVQRLRVTSKTSTLQYANTELSLTEIGRDLGVANVIEGLVARDEDSVSIAVQLLDTSTDEHIWSARFEDKLENVMYLQSRVALAIANQVKVDVTAADRQKFQSAQTVEPEAYLAFLRGVFHVERFNPDDMQLAAEHFQRAVSIDATYALGHWGLGKLCTFMGQAGFLTPAEAREQCLPHIEKALELDPFLPEAHLGRAGTLTWQHFDLENARYEFERALELNPSYAEAHMFYSHYLGIMGEMEASSDHMQLALGLDPLNPFLQGLYSIQLFMLEDYEQAISVADAALAAAPGLGFGHLTLYMSHHELGNNDAAIRSLANMLRYTVGQPEAAEAIEKLYGELGYEGAMLAFARQLEQMATMQYVPPITIAGLYDYGGDSANAIAWFREAFEQGDPDTPYLGVNVKNPEIQAHPDFQLLLRDIGLDAWADRYATN